MTEGRILLAGATGFVGRHLLPVLVESGALVRCGTRDRSRVDAEAPQRVEWVHLDLADCGSVERAMAGCRAAVYLVHAMGGGKGYEERERIQAQNFAVAASQLERIVYLGGVAPSGPSSAHLQSRITTGELLRQGTAPVFELRAGMIIGEGSISWQIVRDLAARLPAMILPRWLSSRSQPVAIADVVGALAAALTLPAAMAGVYDLPGPETLSAKEILVRIARLRGKRPIMLSVPILSPRLSSYWLKLVSGADYSVARELVLGLSSDSLATQPHFWTHLPEHELMTFDEAARQAMKSEYVAGALR